MLVVIHTKEYSIAPYLGQVKKTWKKIKKIIKF